MTHKSRRIAEWTAGLRHESLDPRYLGFFHLFNQQQFFEAHEVLEDLWLEDRSSPDYCFYKGLIQLAGAFVHLQKGRPQPAQALLKLAAENLLRYPAVHHELSVLEVRQMVTAWLQRAGRLIAGENAFAQSEPPRLELAGGAHAGARG